MYKKVEDIFSAADGNRTAPTIQPTIIPEPAAAPVSQNGNASEAEKIRAMGNRLAKIWED